MVASGFAIRNTVWYSDSAGIFCGVRTQISQDLSTRRLWYFLGLELGDVRSEVLKIVYEMPEILQRTTSRCSSDLRRKSVVHICE